jgi:osmotically inducible protein OsmC
MAALASATAMEWPARSAPAPNTLAGTSLFPIRTEENETMADRRATATWNGSLFEGKGTVSAASSGLFTDAEVTWASRTEDAGGATSPEELIASAHAACFGMALSNELSSRGHEPATLRLSATCSFVNGKITTMALEVSAEVPGVDEAGFREGVEAAETSCPVSNALRGNVDIILDASLVS